MEYRCYRPKCVPYGRHSSTRSKSFWTAGESFLHYLWGFKAQNQHLSNIPVQTCRDAYRLSQEEQKLSVLMCLEQVNISYSESMSVSDGWIVPLRRFVQWGNFSINKAVFSLSFLLNYIISAYRETANNLGFACFVT